MHRGLVQLILQHIITTKVYCLLLCPFQGEISVQVQYMQMSRVGQNTFYIPYKTS